MSASLPGADLLLRTRFGLQQAQHELKKNTPHNLPATGSASREVNVTTVLPEERYAGRSLHIPTCGRSLLAGLVQHMSQPSPWIQAQASAVQT